jgi:hypothetical protein
VVRRLEDKFTAKAQRSPRDVEIKKEWRLIESRNTGSKNVLKTLAFVVTWRSKSLLSVESVQSAVKNSF